MSTTFQFSAPSEAVEYPYRAISRGAIVSIVLLVLALPGLIPTFEGLLVLTIPALVAAFMGLRGTMRYPDEYSGQMLAVSGLALNGLLLLGGTSLHTYIYLTEVPEGYQRVGFQELEQPQHLPDVPTARSLELDGQPVFLKGYIHPASGDGRLRQFIMVGDLGTCCFGGQPRSTSMIEVTLTGGQTVRSSLMKMKLAGTLSVSDGHRRTADFDNPVYYRLRADMAW